MTKLYQKRLKMLKELSWNNKVLVSKTGSYYVHLSEPKPVQNFREYNIYNITKSTIDKLGQEMSFNTMSNHVLLLTKDNKLKYKKFEDVFFKPLSINSIRFGGSVKLKLASIYFFNKKCEWIKNDLKYLSCKLATQFKSKKEFKNFLGFDFISNKQFEDRFNFNFKFLLTIYNRKDKVDIYNTTTPVTVLTDILKMSNDLDYPVTIYNSKTRNKETHDHLVKLMVLQEMSHISNEPTNHFWKGLNYLSNVEVLDTPQKLFIEGKRQYHCLFSKKEELNKYLFLSIIDNEKRYTIQLNSKIIEAKGKYNTSVPSNILEKISNLLLKYPIKFNIKKK